MRRKRTQRLLTTAIAALLRTTTCYMAAQWDADPETRLHVSLDGRHFLVEAQSRYYSTEGLQMEDWLLQNFLTMP